LALKRNPKPPKRSHATPRVYLCQFSADGEMLWVYDKVDQEYRTQAVDETGIVKNLYAIHLRDGVKSSEGIERGLSDLAEGPMGPVYVKLNDRAALTLDDVFVMFKFAALQKVRVPAQKHAQERRVKEVLGSENKDPNLFVRTLLRVAPQLAGQFVDLDSRLLVAPLGYSFITSDNPFVVIQERNDRLIPSPEEQYSPTDVLSLPGATGFMPFSPKVCLFFKGSGHHRGYGDATPTAVNHINDWIAHQGQRFLYAADKSDLRQVLWRAR
jgi:hypothetical protein